MLMGRVADCDIDLSRAIAIEDGLMEYDSLVWLAHQASRHERIVELGSFTGISTRALADNTPGVVYALDNWEGPWDTDLPTETRKRLFETFSDHVSDLVESGKVVPVKCDHRNPPKGLKPDMVFIDGDHAETSVRRDIGLWLKEIQPGGLICGHDWNLLQVRSVVSEFFSIVYVEPNGQNIWSVNV